MEQLLGLVKKNRKRAVAISGSSLLILCLCCVSISSTLSRFTSSEPTPTAIDLDAVKTHAVETVMAQGLFQTAIVPTLENTQPAQATNTSQPTPTSLPTSTSLPLATATQSVTGLNCIPTSEFQKGVVVDIVDGDTIKVLIEGATYTVRYIGIDTPENTKEVEYYGPEAAAKNSELVYGKEVSLYKDVSDKDQYGRLLRYVISDGIFINLELVAIGYASAAEYPPDTACAPVFAKAERAMKTSKAGMWGAPPTVVYVAPTSVAGGGTTGGYGYDTNGDGKVTCADFSTRAAAQAAYNAGQTQLDGNDNDGRACETLP